MAEQRALLEARTSHLEMVNQTADERIATLTAIVRMLERSRYGTRSERLRVAMDDANAAQFRDEIVGTHGLGSRLLPHRQYDTADHAMHTVRVDGVWLSA